MSQAATYTIDVNTDAARRSVEALIKQFAQLANVKVSGPSTDGVTAGLKAQAGALTGLQNAYRTFAGFAASYVGFSAIAGQLNAVGDAIEKQQATLSKLRFANNGDVAKAAEDYAFLTAQAERLGQPLDALGKSFGGLAAATNGTQLQGAATRQIFLGIAESATVLNMSAQDTEGALLAVTQMASRATIGAEEFSGQLGERVPFALEAGARALGVTRDKFKELLDAGKIKTESFLPKFAEELRRMAETELPNATDSFVASKNRLSNAVLELRQDVGEGELGAAMKKSIDGMTDALRSPQVAEGFQLLSLGFVKAGEAAVQLFGLVSSGTKIVGSMAAMAASDIVAGFSSVVPGVREIFNKVVATVKEAFANILDSLGSGARSVPLAGGLADSLQGSAAAIRAGARANREAAAGARKELDGIKRFNELRKSEIEKNLFLSMKPPAAPKPAAGAGNGKNNPAITNLPTVTPAAGAGKGDGGKAAKAAEDQARKDAAALDALNKSLADYSRAQAAALREKALAELDADLQKQLVSQQDYLQKKADIERAALDEETRIANARIDELQKVADDEKLAKDERLKAAAEIVKVRGELLSLDGKKAVIGIRLDAESDAVRKYLKDLGADLQAQLQELAGDSAGAARSRLATETAKMLEDPRVKGSSEIQALIERVREAKAAIIELDEATRLVSVVNDELATKERAITRDRERQAIDEVEAQDRIRQARLEAAAAMLPQIEAAEKLAAVTGDPARIEEVKQLREAYVELAGTMDALAVDINETFFGSIRQGFKDLVSGAKSFGDVLRTVITDVLSKLADLYLDRALTGLLGSLGGAGGGIGGALANIFRGRAVGGAVHAGGAYIVGERGPEPFFPGAPGTIVPTARLQSALADMLGISARRAPTPAFAPVASPVMGMGSANVNVSPTVVISALDTLNAIAQLPAFADHVTAVVAGRGQRIQASWKR